MLGPERRAPRLAPDDDLPEAAAVAPESPRSRPGDLSVEGSSALERSITEDLRSRLQRRRSFDCDVDSVPPPSPSGAPALAAASKTQPLLQGIQEAPEPLPGTPLRRRAMSEDTLRSKRLNRLVEEGEYVLGAGFGGAIPHFISYQQPSFRRFCVSSNVIVIMAFAISMPLVVVLQVRSSLKKHESLFLEDLSDAYVRLATAPVACALTNWFVQHLRHACFWWEKGNKSSSRRWCCDPLSAPLMLIALLALLRDACSYALNEYAAGSFRYALGVLIAFVLLVLWFKLLDLVDEVIKGMADDQQIINNFKSVKKMQGIVKSITRHSSQESKRQESECQEHEGQRHQQHKQAEKDLVYCFKETNTVPAKVLAYIWWLYYFFAHLIGGMIFIAVLLQDQETISRFIVGGLLVSSAASGSLIFELGPNTISLLRLSLYKPFYVGDLITLNSTGSMSSPATSIMGFVENITIMYVVIRNFEMKQTWISHDVFNKMIIQNWTRRPTKTVLLNIGISCRCPLARVEKVVDFARRWIKKSPEIQQKNYQKSHITKTGSGYNLEVIFFPVIGVSHRAIRQKFLVAFMAAAERLKVPLVPLGLMCNFGEAPARDAAWPAPDAPGGGAYPGEADAFEDLMPGPEVELKDE